jgi:nitrate/nitrite transporter NarK
VVIHKGVSTGAAAGIGVGVAIAVLIGPLMVISWFLWKRKAEKRGHARPWKPELQGESRVVNELIQMRSRELKWGAYLGGFPRRFQGRWQRRMSWVGEVSEPGARGAKL